MIDPAVQHLLEQVIDSPVKLHLLLIFHEHSRMEVTAAHLAERTCRDIWSVSQALHELAEDGLLSYSGPAGAVAYRYAPRHDLHDPIRRLIRNYDDPITRDLLLRSIRELAAYAPFRRSSAWERSPIISW